jgi:hypothetical protein
MKEEGVLGFWGNAEGAQKCEILSGGRFENFLIF